MRKLLILSIIALASMSSCDSMNDEHTPRYAGRYTKAFTYKLMGFEESKEEILEKEKTSMRDFQIWSTSDVNDLKPQDQKQIKDIREEVKKPHDETLLQKIISLKDIPTYMNNIYGGTIGGFITTAADVKQLSTMQEVYDGLRLDYEGSTFFVNGAGYGVIRYYSNSADKLSIPYADALGGNQQSSWEWPWGGAGFTTSTLGYGGYPEYFAEGYDVPEEGAEIYEVTPEGREMLRSVFNDGQWETYENPDIPLPPTYKAKTTQSNDKVRNGMHLVRGKMTYIKTVAQYKNYDFIVRGEVDGKMHLTTTKKYNLPELYVVEKGIWGVIADKEAVTYIKEVY